MADRRRQENSLGMMVKVARVREQGRFGVAMDSGEHRGGTHFIAL